VHSKDSKFLGWLYFCSQPQPEVQQSQLAIPSQRICVQHENRHMKFSFVMGITARNKSLADSTSGTAVRQHCTSLFPRSHTTPSECISWERHTTTHTQQPSTRLDKITPLDIPKMVNKRRGSKPSHLHVVHYILELRSSLISRCRTCKVSHASNVSQVQAHTLRIEFLAPRDHINPSTQQTWAGLAVRRASVVRN